jgi:hypothetical protein
LLHLPESGGREGVMQCFIQVQFLSTHELRIETTTKNARIRKPEKILFIEVFVLVMYYFHQFWKSKNLHLKEQSASILAKNDFLNFFI